MGAERVKSREVGTGRESDGERVRQGMDGQVSSPTKAAKNGSHEAQIRLLGRASEETLTFRECLCTVRAPFVSCQFMTSPHHTMPTHDQSTPHRTPCELMTS